MKSVSAVLRVLSLALLLGFALVSAHASTLNGPFPQAFPPDTFGPCAGCTQLAFVSTPNVVSSTGSFTASLDSAVYSDPSNTFCAGCLDFVYQISNSAGSMDSIGRVTVSNFADPSTWEVDAGYSTGGEPGGGGIAFPTGTWAPGLVDRNTPDTIGFLFSDVATPIPAGGTSVVLVIETNATTFQPGTASALDGGTANFAAFEPASPSSPTPEPSSILMLVTGLGTLLAGARRFRSN